MKKYYYSGIVCNLHDSQWLKKKNCFWYYSSCILKKFYFNAPTLPFPSSKKKKHLFCELKIVFVYFEAIFPLWSSSFMFIRLNDMLLSFNVDFFIGVCYSKMFFSKQVYLAPLSKFWFMKAFKSVSSNVKYLGDG